jgi:hypothetical protein
MSQRSNVGSAVDTSGEWRGRSECPPRNVVEGYVEIVAQLTDAAEHVVSAVLDNSPWFGARRSADTVRHTPEAVRQAALAWNDGMINVSNAIVDFLDLRNWDRSRAADCRHSRETNRTVSGDRHSSEAEIVEIARRFIVRGRYRGATLDGLIEHLRLQTSLPDDELSAIIKRHFLVDDDLVFSSRDEGTAESSDLPDSVEAHLRALGYSDIRRDVPLERLDHSGPRARMVAYEGGKAVVLVYLAPRRRLTDAAMDEDARFQAKALSKTASPKFIYLTDGRFNRFVSVEDGRVVESLPRAGQTS